MPSYRAVPTRRVLFASRLLPLALFALATLPWVACGGEAPRSAATPAAAASAEPAAPAKPAAPAFGPRDWSGVALAPTSVQIVGTQVSIDLPAGLKIDRQTEDTVDWIAAEGGKFSQPRLTVTKDVIPPKSLESAIKFGDGASDRYLADRKEEVDGGYIVTVHSDPAKGRGDYAKTTVWRKAGDLTLKCVAAHSNDDGLERLDATLKWLESVCLSMKAGEKAGGAS